MDYSETKCFLNSLQMHKIKLGLDAMQYFLQKTGEPEKRCRFVHIAGTNGKGSVCAVLAQVLSQSGYRIGIYSSPHLCSPRERIRINATAISENDFARFSTQIRKLLNGKKITYFEFLTALSLLYFSENSVDLVLLETGMGGRLDATNVVVPLISVITSISMDHTDYLGETLGEIAAEKAGIIKHSIPVVTAENFHGNKQNNDAIQTIKKIAEKKHAPLFCLHHEFDYTEKDTKWNWYGKSSSLHGNIEDLSSATPDPARKINDSLSIAVLRLLEPYGFRVSNTDIRNGIASAHWAGRMEFFPYTEGDKQIHFLLDGSHNESSIANLSTALFNHFATYRRIALLGCMADKNIDSIMQQIAPCFDHIILTKPAGVRSAEPEIMKAALPKTAQKHAICIRNPIDALKNAKYSTQNGDLIVVCGSLYLIGEIRPLLRKKF